MLLRRLIDSPLVPLLTFLRWWAGVLILRWLPLLVLSPLRQEGLLLSAPPGRVGLTPRPALRQDRDGGGQAATDTTPTETTHEQGHGSRSKRSTGANRDNSRRSSQRARSTPSRIRASIRHRPRRTTNTGDDRAIHPDSPNRSRNLAP